MEDRTCFTFQAQEYIGSQIQRDMFNRVYVEDGTKWTEVLRYFTDFMATVYGYSVDDKIIIKDNDGETLLRDYF